MRCFTIENGKAALRKIPVPKLQPRQVLVKVHAAGLNRVDSLVLQAAAAGNIGSHGVSLGRELCGTVEEVGLDVQTLRKGQTIIAFTSGAIADYAVVDERTAVEAPLGNLTPEDAAVLPVALNTMHDALVTRGELKPGQSVLIQGASSAVGIMAMQIARELRAGLVIGTSRDTQRRALLLEHGADLALDTDDSNWVNDVLEATDGAGVDLIIDQISAPVANDNLRATRLEGRIVNVGRLGGNTGSFDFDLHAERRITYIGVTFRTRSIEETGAIIQKAWENLGPAVQAGRLRIPISRRYRLDQAGEALNDIARNQGFGKIVITMD
ncbi:MAG: zinc-binding dehydrogenase [Pararhodobacter sp.]|nr:zinc-binding dehydrogenase [Pararhodobacter sp.]